SELMARTAHIEVLAPAGAQVTLDGIAQGVAPLADTVDVDPGKHHIEVRNGAAPAKSVDADAVVGQIAHVSFLAADAPPVVAGGTPTPPATDPQPPSPDTPPPMHSDPTFWN